MRCLLYTSAVGVALADELLLKRAAKGHQLLIALGQLLLADDAGQRLGVLHLGVAGEQLVGQCDVILAGVALSLIHISFVNAHIYTPNDYVGPLMDLCQTKRGVLVDMKYMDETRVDLHYQLPLGEIVYDFFDAIKSRSRGYASYDYEWEGWHESKLVRLDFLLLSLIHI